MKREDFDVRIWNKIKKAQQLLWEAEKDATVVDSDIYSHLTHARSSLTRAEGRCQELTKID